MRREFREQLMKCVPKLSMDSLLSPFILTEFQDTMEAMNTGKTPGREGIPLEIFKALHEWHPIFLQAINRWRQEGTIPDILKQVDICLLYKDGEKDLIKNYRPIALSEVLLKIMGAMTLRRMTKLIQAQIPGVQAGFVPGRSTDQNTFYILSIIHKAMKTDTPLYLFLIDFE